MVRRRLVYELVDSDEEQSDNEKNAEVPLDETSDIGVSVVGLSDNVLTTQDDDADDVDEEGGVEIFSISSISDG